MTSHPDDRHSTDVPCPTCQAEKGQRCENPNGDRRSFPHRERNWVWADWVTGLGKHVITAN